MATDNTKRTDQGLTASDNAIQIFQQNPGTDFSAAEIKAINDGTLVALPAGSWGPTDPRLHRPLCITRLTYDHGDNDLSRVQFDSGFALTKGNAKNLNDFRDSFQAAANNGFGITACLYVKSRKLVMVNLISCECACEDKKVIG